MAKKFFGTDGIRDTANQGVMTAEVALQLGMAAGGIFTNGGHRHRVIIGKDTRLSGYLIESALTAGFISVGMDVVMVGPMPTPAVAMLTRSLRADLGVVISASHNPYYDNGIKLFGPDGFKLSDKVELRIEKLMHHRHLESFLAKPRNLGKAKRLDDAPGRYIEFVKNTFPKGKTLDGLKIVIDCANGAAYSLGPTILQELGAELIPIAVTPDGFNINNECGSSFPTLLIENVKKHNANLGIALDGDADRLLVVDECGNVIDGDQILAAIAGYFHANEMLTCNKVVATIMSNLGLEYYLRKLKLSLVRTKVGDRYVAEAMQKYKSNVGGEQSGHIILGNYNTTGDGLIAALQLLAIMVEDDKCASEICPAFEPLPQILRNVSYNKLIDLSSLKLQKLIKESNNKLSGKGRLIIRKSGTEPLIRIMAEGENETLIKQLVDDIENELRG
ncbi:Phosphoglucosamine mutase [Rickettsiales bacterium Ac37b]|nr:Phosphoglucosamine mutase [Rickettsiales bacterium Ac37b]